LFMNGGNNVLTDATDDAAVRPASWGWGCIFFDMDNDQDFDLAVTNGQWTNLDIFKVDQTRLFENVHGNGRDFVEKQDDYGITDTSVGKSAIAFDFDNDGDMDLAISQTGPGLILYENKFDNNNGYLKLKTPGSESNAMGVGAQISVWVNQGDEPLYQEMGVNSHYLGHGDPTVAHFGLGAGSAPVFKVQVHWPVSGLTEVRNNVPRNTLVVIPEPINSSEESTVDTSFSTVSTDGTSLFSTFSTQTFSYPTFSYSPNTFSDSSNSPNTNSDSSNSPNTNSNSGSDSSSSGAANVFPAMIMLAVCMFALF